MEGQNFFVYSDENERNKMFVLVLVLYSRILIIISRCDMKFWSLRPNCGGLAIFVVFLIKRPHFEAYLSLNFYKNFFLPS